LPTISSRIVDIVKMLSSKQELFNQIHPSKNKIDVNALRLQSNKKLWWLCEKGHEWEASVVNRNKGCGCPYCSNRKVCSDNSLLARFPHIAAEWHPSKNTTIPDNILPGTNVKYWWRCSKNSEHVWETSPNVRCIKGGSCPHCRGNTTFGGNTLAEKHPDIAAEWHPTRNGMLLPTEICPNSDRKVWWKCANNHEYESQCSNRTRGTCCPYCTSRKSCDDNNLKVLYPAIAAEWHPTKNDTKPEDYTAFSGKKVWWRCNINAHHEWSCTIVNRTDKKTNCPMCSGRVVHSTNSLQTLYPNIAAEWHPTKNGLLTAADVTKGKSSIYIWWQCKKNTTHEWKSTVSNRTNGSGCPYCCMSHMEKKVIEYLQSNNIMFESQKRFSELGKYSFDFYLPNENALIECDGRQHFEEALNFFHHQKSLLQQRKRDIKKNAFVLVKNIPLLRIAYTEEKYINTIVFNFINRIKREKTGIVFSNPFLYKRSYR